MNKTDHLRGEIRDLLRKTARRSVELQLLEQFPDQAKSLSTADTETMVDHLAACLEHDLAETTMNVVDFNLGEWK